MSARLLIARPLALASLTALACWVTTTAIAQPAAPGAAASPPASDWTIRAGAALISGPRWPGADDSRALLVPVFDVRYKQFLFINPNRGIGVEIPLAQDLRGSAALGLDLTSRKEKDSPRLLGLGDVKSSAALLLELNYQPGSAFVKAGLSSRLGSGNSRGTTFEADLGYNLVKSPGAVLGVGLNLQTMDGTYAKNFFGVNAQQSVASKLPTFQASSGLKSSGLFAQGFYRIDNDWSAFGRLNLYQLQGDAAKSPIIQQKGQTTLVVGALRTF
jgi:MipA family protein